MVSQSKSVKNNKETKSQGKEKSSLRLTNQRAVILDYFKDNYSHPSVDDVFNSIKKKLPRISKKTVYANLQTMCGENLLQEVKIKGVQRYEPKLPNHAHVLCMKCGKIEDTDSESIISDAMKSGKKIKGFEVVSVSVVFYGICENCKGGK